MIASITVDNNSYTVNLFNPIHISLPVSPYLPQHEQRNAFHCDLASVKLQADTRCGGSVNAPVVSFAPHGNGTHTECIGHISVNRISIHDFLCNEALIMPSVLVTISPSKLSDTSDTYPFPNTSPDDLVLTKHSLETAFGKLSNVVTKEFFTSIVIRTLPNPIEKRQCIWMTKNPPYFTFEACQWLVLNGCRHVLIDLPSVDRTDDGGLLMAHRTLFQVPTNVNLKQLLDGDIINALPRCSITELCYISNDVDDGIYLLSLSLAPFDLDCSPSSPKLFHLTKYLKN